MNTKIIPIIPYNKNKIELNKYNVPGYIFKLAKMYINNDIKEVDFIPINNDLFKQYGNDFRLVNEVFNKVLQIGDGVDLYLQPDILVTKDIANIVGKEDCYYMIGFYKQFGEYKGLYTKCTEEQLRCYKTIVMNMQIQPTNEAGKNIDVPLIVKSELVNMRYQPILQFKDSDEILQDYNSLFNIKQINDEATDLKLANSYHYSYLAPDTTIDYDGMFNNQPMKVIGVNVQQIISDYEQSRDFHNNNALKTAVFINSLKHIDDLHNIRKTKLLHVRIESKIPVYVNFRIVTTKLLINQQLLVNDNQVIKDQEWDEVLYFLKMLIKNFYYKDLKQLIDLLSINNVALKTMNTEDELDLLKLLHKKQDIKHKLLYLLQMIKDESLVRKDEENNKIIQ